jgi:hypothetical protein
MTVAMDPFLRFHLFSALKVGTKLTHTWHTTHQGLLVEAWVMGSELPSPAQSPDIGRANFFDSGFTPTLYVNMRTFIGSKLQPS